MKTITLATFNSPAQAEPLRRRLEEAHIHTWTHEGGILKHLWFVHRPKAEVRLDVEAKDLQKSRQLMEALETNRETKTKVIHCPECHSSRVIYPQFTRKFFLPNLVGLLAGLGLVEKQYYCEDCHYTWLPKDRKRHKHRAHMAPNYFLEDVSDSNPEPAEKARPADWQEKKRSALDD